MNGISAYILSLISCSNILCFFRYYEISCLMDHCYRVFACNPHYVLKIFHPEEKQTRICQIVYKNQRHLSQNTEAKNFLYRAENNCPFSCFYYTQSLLWKYISLSGSNVHGTVSQSRG